MGEDLILNGDKVCFLTLYDLHCFKMFNYWPPFAVLCSKHCASVFRCSIHVMMCSDISRMYIIDIIS